MDNLISVIIPAYNVAPWLPRCLDSILAQTHKSLEIIVVNDGSTDATSTIAEKYVHIDSRVVLINKKNGGVTSARLEGVRRATGKYIGFVDGDDEIESNMYQQLLLNAQKYNANISHCGYQMCFPDKRVHYFHNTGIIVKQKRITAVKELLSGLMIEPGLWNKLYHRSLFDKLLYSDVIDENIIINEDLLMNFYLFSSAENTVFEDLCLYHYNVREESATRSKLNSSKIYDPIKVKRIILSVAEDTFQEDAKRAYINTCINSYHMILFAGAEYQKDIQTIRELLDDEINSFTLLGKKRALMAWMIVRVPFLYKLVYAIYSRYFKKNIYS